MAKKNTSNKVNAPSQEQAKARRKAAQNKELATVEEYKAVHEPEAEVEAEETAPEIVETEQPEIVSEAVEETPRETVSEEAKIMAATPFQTLQNKVKGGTVSTVIGYFPVGATNAGLVFRNEDGTPQEQWYSINIGNIASLYSLFAYKISPADKARGGKYSPKEFTARFVQGGYVGLAEFLNELDKVTKRSFDRNPVLFRIANGTFDDGEYKNEIVGALMTYNELENERLLKLIEDGNIANLISHSFISPDALEAYFKLNHELPEDLGMQVVGLIQNGTSGKVSFNFKAVIRSANGKYQYVLPELGEDGGFAKMRGRNRHMGWLDKGVNEFVEAVEKIAQINYVETLSAITFDNVWRIFESARTILVNDDKVKMDAEKSEITINTLRVRCKVAGYTTGLQAFNEATILAEIHGNGKYLNPILDKVFDLIFCQ